MFPVAAGQTSGAPSAVACRSSVTTGSSSYSTMMASSASFACSAVSATTAATASPTKRTVSYASAWTQRRGARRAVRSLEHRRQRQRLHTRRDQVATGQHRHHAGHRLRHGSIDRDDPRMRVRRPQKAQKGLLRERKVVGKAAAPASKPASSIRRTSRPLPKRPIADRSFIQSLCRCVCRHMGPAGFIARAVPVPGFGRPFFRLPVRSVASFARSRHNQSGISRRYDIAMTAKTPRKPPIRLTARATGLAQTRWPPSM